VSNNLYLLVNQIIASAFTTDVTKEAGSKILFAAAQISNSDSEVKISSTTDQKDDVAIRPVVQKWREDSYSIWMLARYNIN